MKILAVALGDPNGIGPEIALKALAHFHRHESLHLRVYGPANVFHRTAARLGLAPLARSTDLVDVGALSDEEAVPGQVNGAAGASTIAAASAALRACRAGEASAVVACPHHETAVAQAGIAFSGYPSLVARVCGVSEDDVFLMLVGGGLRIVHATLHESVAHAIGRITPELVMAAVLAGVRACAMLGVTRPTIGLFGVNPHASEGGLFGSEDARLVAPAAERLRAQGLRLDGPLGADLLLSQRRHDLYVAMLHDQGHIPVKLLAPNAASALSLGADVLLSSVGHGCAMDIAGRGIANPDALIRTVSMLAGIDNPTAPTRGAAS
jgi:1,2-dihydroxy-3,5-cyclohexadiene-1,4-dicarboxylate dehydrogenase